MQHDARLERFEDEVIAPGFMVGDYVRHEKMFLKPYPESAQ
jgi:hypothetical protein